MTYPHATGGDKRYTNTFLWDYYYKNAAVHNRKDANDDTYQTYYESAHTHTSYPMLSAAKPYILGLPGSTYYEFDLSGNFEAQNTKEPITKLEKQIISFVSQPGIAIGISDKQMIDVTKDGYTFRPSFMNMELEAGKNYFTLKPNYDSDGNGVADFSAFDKVPATGDATKVGAFRPYFITAGDGARATRSIVFSNNENSEMPHEESDSYDKDDNGRISVMTSHLKIDVKSTLKETVNVRILTMNGITINTFALEPGQTVETRLSNAGVYIVQSADGKLLKKLTVR
jgi:hypothetical protein